MKDHNQILEELNQVFRTVFKDKSIVVSSHTTAADIRDWDSLNHMRLIAEIEDHFHCEFSFEEVIRFKNVGDVVQTLSNKT